MKAAALGLIIFGIVLGVVAFLLPGARLGAEPIVAVRGVSPDATNDNGQRKLARTSDGTLFVAVSAPIDGVEQAQVHFSLDGGANWKPDLVLGQDSVWSDLAALAAGPDGRLDAAWVDYTTVGHVWHASRIDGSWSTQEKVSPGEDYAGFPAMAITSEGAHLLWYAVVPGADTSHGSSYDIEYVNDSSRGWSDPELLSTGSDDALNPSLAKGPDESLSAAWFQVVNDTYGAHFASRVAGEWTSQVTVSPLAQQATGVSIEVDGEGTTHMVWEQMEGDQLRVGYSRHDGSSWSEPVLLSDGFSSDPVVAVNDDDEVVVLWSEEKVIKGKHWTGSWSGVSEVGSGTNPSSLSGQPAMAAWTRETDAGYEVVTTALFMETPLVSPWLMASIGLVLAGIGLVLHLRTRIRSGAGHTRNGEH